MLRHIIDKCLLGSGARGTKLTYRGFDVRLRKCNREGAKGVLLPEQSTSRMMLHLARLIEMEFAIGWAKKTIPGCTSNITRGSIRCPGPCMRSDNRPNIPTISPKRSRGKATH